MVRDIYKLQLQWVHGPITVVITVSGDTALGENRASMGPRSDNRGYLSKVLNNTAKQAKLQWVHGPITVVIDLRYTYHKG